MFKGEVQMRNEFEEQEVSEGKRKTLHFVTKNENKYKEVAKILESRGIHVEWVNIEIHEIQSNNMDAIACDKVLKAFEKIMAPVIIEHDGLIVEELGRIPGGLTQVFWDELKKEKFGQFFARDKEAAAIAKSVIAYCDGKKIKLFRGETEGKIIGEPRGNSEFQWDCVFCPQKSDRTYAEMSDDEKNETSMRNKALNELIQHLDKKQIPVQSEKSLREISYEQLKESIRTGNTILFVGAGISASVGLPDWETLMEHLANQLGYESKVFRQYGDNLDLAEYYRQEKSFGKLQSWMKKKWDVEEEKIRNSEIYEAITKLNFPIIYTTNYDRCLEKAMDIWGKKYKTIIDVKDMANLEPDIVQIVKFHGDVMDKDSIVLSESQYFDRLNFETSLDIKLRADMLGKSILFVGYSLSDINIRMMLYKLKQLWEKSETESRPKSYIFLLKKNPIQEKILRSIGVEPVYSVEHGKKEAIVSFLKKLL